MDEIDVLCREILNAISTIRGQFFSVPSNFESMIQPFWALQDYSSRLIEMVFDHQPKSIQYLRQKYPDLAGSVHDAIGSTMGLPLGNLPAVDRACQFINRNFTDLHQIQ
jgi:hypothetical protein